MSTKIYNGLKIEANSLDEAIEIIHKGKSDVVEIYTDMAVKEEFFLSLHMMTAYLLDKSEILKKSFKINLSPSPSEIDEKSSAMGVAYMQVLDSVENKPEISMVIYPGRVELNNKNYYLMTIYGDNVMEKHMREIYQEKISEYAYWDNSDEPDDVTKQEWSMRKQHWEKVLLSKSSTPSIEGLTINFLSHNKPTAYLSGAQRLENLEKMCNIYKETYQSFFVEPKKIEMMVEILSKSTKSTGTSALKQKVRSKDFNSQELAQYEKLEKIINQKVPDLLSPEIMRTPLIDLKKNLNTPATRDKLHDGLAQKKPKI